MGLIERIKRLIRVNNLSQEKESPQIKPDEADLLGKVNLHRDMQAMKAMALHGEMPEDRVKIRYGLTEPKTEGLDSHEISKAQMSLMQEAELIFLSRASSKQISEYQEYLNDEKGTLEMIATNGIEHSPECSSSFYQRYGMDCMINDYQDLKRKQSEFSDCGEYSASLDKQMKEVNGKIRLQAECGCKRIENVQSEFKKEQKGTEKVPELLLRFSLFSKKEKSEKKASTQKQSKTF